MRGILFGLSLLLLMACLPFRPSSPTSAALTVTKERPPLASQTIYPTPPTPQAIYPTPLATTAAPPTPQAQATSRGSQLVASDPQTVRVGNGKPVLIEFFRFT